MTLGGSEERRRNPPPRFAWWVNGHNGNMVIRTPHWPLVLLSAALAVAPWFKWRFSLSTLLIATTLVAVGLGIVVALR
jgi:hypothetical protein